MPLTATSGTVSWSRGRSRRPTPAEKPSCRTTTGAQSPVRSVVRGSTTRTSATTSNASRRSSRPRTAVARAVARATPTRTVARARPRAMAKANVARAKADEEAMTASQTRTRAWTPSGGSPNPTPGGNTVPSGGQPNMGPTTSSQKQAQQEQGTRRANKDGDQSNFRKRSRFLLLQILLALFGDGLRQPQVQ